MNSQTHFNITAQSPLINALPACRPPRMRMQRHGTMSRMAALFVGAAAVIAFFATASNSSAQQFAVWLDGDTTPHPDPILSSLDHTFGPGHWTLVSTADLETLGFLANFDTLIMSRTNANFGITSISASAAANITAYVGSGAGQGGVALFTNDAQDNFFGTQWDPFDPNLDRMFVNAARFTSATHHGFIGELNGAIIALNTLHLLAGSASAVRQYGLPFTYDMGPAGVDHAVNSGVTFPFTDLDQTTFLADVSGADTNNIVDVFSSPGVAGEPAVLANFASTFLQTERLNVQALSGATHSAISDANLSGGAGTQLNATGTGQYVVYTVPVSAAGTYKVRIGITTGPKRGIFRLSIDGLNQGQAQDEYTSAVGYTFRDLGTVTFFGGGNKGFQFLVSGKNVSSSGYVLGLDYIELIPTNRQETESLKVQSKTPAPDGVFSGATAASGGAGTFFNANAVGNYITYTVPIAKAGTYQVRVGTQSRSNKGIFQLSINGTKQGVAVDEYSFSLSYGVVDLGTVTFLNTGDQSFTFTVKGKNAASTGYTLAFDYIELIPTNRQETESLKVQSKTPAPDGVFSGATAASGGAGTFFNANAIGNFITYTVPVAKPGTYHLRVGIQTRPNKGMWQLAINNLNIGQPQDEYYPSLTYGVRDLGAATFSVAGNYAFKFTVAGKNASSTGYTLAFDYIELVP